ncbi:uncharacterized protein E0L32_005730 [Thyridium curvatum]|uniref:Uncharacterized protein n=1 Tax=Thyridium curvatum TaxID=1093900 RepID=A0A507B3Z2_9PEZI|nr:uncharacterized protein E0L32_005730 [Thyridium curvatum]TPX13786.1 hypothetical protein E0L32_005730 [Thyridium curvatum]
MASINEKTAFTVAHEEQEQLPVPVMAGGTGHAATSKSGMIVWGLKALLTVCCLGLGITLLCQLAASEASFADLANKFYSLEKMVDPNGTLTHTNLARDLGLAADGTSSTSCLSEITLTPGFTTQTALPVQGTQDAVLTSYETIYTQTTVTLTSAIGDATPAIDGYTSTTTITEPSSTMTVTIASAESGADCSAGVPSTVTIYVTGTPELATPYETTSTATGLPDSISHVLTTVYTTLTSTMGDAETVITSQIVQTETEIVTIGLYSSSSSSSSDFYETWSVDGASASAELSSSALTTTTTTAPVVAPFLTTTINGSTYANITSGGGSGYLSLVTATYTSTVLGSHNASFVPATATLAPFSGGEKLACPLGKFMTGGLGGIVVVAVLMTAFA